MNNAHRRAGFTLVELLVVVGIFAAMAAISASAFHSLNGSSSVNKAASDLSRTLELARCYAMAHNTIVRVGFGGTSAGPVPAMVVQAFYSTDGSGMGAMEDAGKWAVWARPLVLNNFLMDDALGADSMPSGTVLPSQTDITGFSYQAGSVGVVRLDSFVQYLPSGEATVLENEPARCIQIGIDRPSPQNGRNPFVLRVSGVNGSIIELRKEDTI